MSIEKLERILLIGFISLIAFYIAVYYIYDWFYVRSQIRSANNIIKSGTTFHEKIDDINFDNALLLLEINRDSTGLISYEHRIAKGGKELLKNNNYLARQEFEAAMHQDLGRYEAYYWLGVVYDLQRNPQNAIDYFNKALNLNKQHLPSALGLADIYIQEKNFEKAKELLNSFIQYNSKSPQKKSAIYLRLGEIEEKNSNIDGAVQYYLKTIKLKPNSVEAYINLGSIKKDQSDFDGSLNYFNKALSIDRNNPDILYNIGLVYINERKFDKAIIMLKQSNKLLPDDTDTLIALGEAYNLKNDFVNGEKFIQNALKLDPSNCNALIALGNLNIKKTALTQAEQYYEKCLKTSPDNAAAINSLGVVKLRQGKIDEAVRLWKKALEINPLLEEAKMNLENISQQLAPQG